MIGIFSFCVYLDYGIISTARYLCIYHHTTKLLVSNIITSRVQQTMLAELSEALHCRQATCSRQQRELRTYM